MRGLYGGLADDINGLIVRAGDVEIQSCCTDTLITPRMKIIHRPIAFRYCDFLVRHCPD
jgi:hypothetical protein